MDMRTELAWMRVWMRVWTSSKQLFRCACVGVWVCECMHACVGMCAHVRVHVYACIRARVCACVDIVVYSDLVQAAVEVQRLGKSLIRCKRTAHICA